MTHPDQYMIYHLTEWDNEKRKWKKKPVGLSGEPLSVGAGIPTSSDRAAVVGTVNALNAGTSDPRYMLGLWLHPDSHFFFLDLDDNAVQDGRLTPLAEAMAAQLVAAGCYFEASSSGRGAHVIGRYTGTLPPHATSRKRVHPHEFFTRDRGCVLNPNAHAGSWDVDATAAVHRLILEHFPPRSAEDDRRDTDQRRPEWRGPEDDNELIRRMLGATGSAAARFSGKATLTDLWNGRCEHTSESDFALASHLAFWTGCDVPRIERLMRLSPLAAFRLDKWDTHRTYLKELTITEACATTTTVYREPERVDTAAALLGTPRPIIQPIAPPHAVVTDAVIVGEDWFTATEAATARINSAGTTRELYEVVFPWIASQAFPVIHSNTLANAANRKLDSMGAKQPISNIKALIAPPRDMLTAALEQTVPEWAQPLVYVLKADKFFDTVTGSEYSHQGLKMQFSRHMPMKQNGTREDPVQWLMERWNITNVDDLEYRPDMPPVFQHAGRAMANQFRASTMPTPVVGSAECSACIELFQRHLWQIVNQRHELYSAVLGWIAHNVQFPGRKIRWAPLIKGVGGDGKSIIGELMFAAMGEANVKITSPSTISNSGGFTDWAMGACVNLIEEIRLEGKERRKLYNALKTILGDGRINPNRKGKSSTETHINVMNHLAFTNYEDATVVEDGDRRLGIIFTPWANADEAARIKGLPSAGALPEFFKRLGTSMKAEPGAWRCWLMGIDLSWFNPDGRAPESDERETMISSSEDYTEQTIRDCIERGCSGVTKEVFDSWSLMNFVQREMGEKPDARSWNRILTDLGYRQVKPLWWNSKTRRVWTKFPLTKDQIVEKLTASAFSPSPVREL